MPSDEVKIQRSKERQAMAELVARVATHPVIMAVAGLAVIEYYQGHDEVTSVPEMQPNGVVYFKQAIRRKPGDGFIGQTAGSVVEGGLVAYLAAESLKEGLSAIGSLK